MSNQHIIHFMVITGGVNFYPSDDFPFRAYAYHHFPTTAFQRTMMNIVGGARSIPGTPGTTLYLYVSPYL